MIFNLSRALRPGITAQQAWGLVSVEGARRAYTHVVGFGAGRSGHLAVTFAAWLDCASTVLVRGNDFDRDWFEPGRAPWVRESLLRATAVGAVAPETVRRIKALFPEQTVVFVPNGVDPAAWELLPDDVRRRDEARDGLAGNGRRIFGLFGELKQKKGVPFWLGALRDTGRMDQVGLLVVGRTVDEETGQILDDPALTPHCLRLPYTRMDRMPGLYAACDFIALPSLYEGMPNVLLEAMVMGVIPVVSEAGAMAEVVRDGDTGFTFPVLDRSAAARAMEKALDLGPDERAAMGRRAREHVLTHFSLERETEALCRLFFHPESAGPPGGV